MENLIGTTLENRYRVLERSGETETTASFMVRDLRSNRLLSLQVLRPDVAEETRARFQRTIGVLETVSSAHVVPLISSGTHGELDYMITDYVQGRKVSAFVQLLGRLSLEVALGIISQAAQGLLALHENNIVHRDIRPERLVVGTDGTVMLAELGLPKPMAGPQVTREGFAPGDLCAYWAPEQIGGVADRRSDVYGLGATLYAMLTGKPPFEQQNDVFALAMQIEKTTPRPVGELVADVPEGVEKWLERSLAKKPADRHAGISEFLEALKIMKGVEIADTAGIRETLEGLPAELVPEEGDAGSAERTSSALLLSDSGREFPVSGELVTLGRDRFQDIDLTPLEGSQYVSRRHAWVEKEGGSWTMRIDPGNKNPSWLNGTRLEGGARERLADGDALRLGGVNLTFKC